MNQLLEQSKKDQPKRLGPSPSQGSLLQNSQSNLIEQKQTRTTELTEKQQTGIYSKPTMMKKK